MSAALYLIRGPFDPDRDLPPRSVAIEVDDQNCECFRAFVTFVANASRMPKNALDLERMWPEGRA